MPIAPGPAARGTTKRTVDATELWRRPVALQDHRFAGQPHHFDRGPAEHCRALPALLEEQDDLIWGDNPTYDGALIGPRSAVIGPPCQSHPLRRNSRYSVTSLMSMRAMTTK